MDSAEETELRRALSQQGVLLGRQQEELEASRNAYAQVSLQLSQLVERLDQLQVSASAAQAAAPVPGPERAVSRHAEPRLNPPAPYSGEPNSCRSFLSQCSLVFALQGEGEQGELSVSVYSIEFRTLAASCGWNEKALWDHFLHGLAEHVKDEIYSLELPAGLDGLIDLAIQVDDRITLRSRHRRGGFPRERVTSAESVTARDTISQCLVLPEEEPMQVGRVMSCSVLQEEPVSLADVPEVYHDLRAVFSKSRASSLPPHRPYDCAIDLLPGTSPPRGRLYSLSGPEREAMERYIHDSLAAGIIRPSSSPAGAGFFFVEKKDGSLCPCIDYRGLNDITVKNRYPLPLMSSAFELLQGATIFTKLDLRSAYHLVRIREGDEWKTAFNTHTGHFEYLVMPFGLSYSPAVFQALVKDVLRDMVDRFVFVYLDDILIFSQNEHDHVQHVRRVLQRLLENRLFAKVEKCQFHAQSVPFLGFVLSPEGIRMDLAKVKAVADWPTPDSRRAVQRFLGFANFYRRFIRNFSQVALPLMDLTSTKKRFCWLSQAQTAFENLKSRFISAPILTTPDSSRQFIVEVDASEVGVGAVLSQRSPSDERIHPCAFFSHRLTPTERNYDIGNRELLAVKLALEEWRHWLEGAGFPFIVWTDHKNLEYIRTAKRMNSRQARWALFFGRFRFTISYRPGSKNGKPDALSRIFEAKASPAPPVAILHPERVVVAAVTWGVESRVRTALGDATVPAGCPESLLFVPESLRTSVLHWGHSSSLACHPGATRTHRLIKQRFWWPSMARDARRFVAACPICAAGKGSNRPPAGLLQLLSVPSRPWSHIAMDFVTGLPPSNGKTVVLTVVD
ncbi:hypothetical protein M9458_035604, partial [Cirrhinus mrigala]